MCIKIHYNNANFVNFLEICKKFPKDLVIETGKRFPCTLAFEEVIKEHIECTIRMSWLFIVLGIKEIMFITLVVCLYHQAFEVDPSFLFAKHGVVCRFPLASGRQYGSDWHRVLRSWRHLESRYNENAPNDL